MFLKTSGGAVVRLPPWLWAWPHIPFAWNVGQWQFCYFGHSQWSSQNEAEEAMVSPKPTC